MRGKLAKRLLIATLVAGAAFWASGEPFQLGSIAGESSDPSGSARVLSGDEGAGRGSIWIGRGLVVLAMVGFVLRTHLQGRAE